MTTLRAYAGRLKRAIRAKLRLRQLERKFHADMKSGTRAPHGLGAPLIISLTSYPPRFPLLRYNLMSLLNQAVPADRVILWIAEGDMARLPANVRRLGQYGLEIRAVPDVRSFKKLVFGIRDIPDAWLVTADDDIAYRRDWLETLVGGVDIADPTIICRRAHRIKRAGDGFAPYLEWDRNVSDAASMRPSTDLLPVGIGGILYPPGALHPQVTEIESFMRLCPHADDLWFWWMGRRQGTRVVRVPEGDIHEEELPGTQSVALTASNWAGGNDRQLAALVAEFGLADIGL